MKSVLDWFAGAPSATGVTLLLAKVTLILVGAAGAALIMRRRSASARHVLWVLTIAGTLGLAGIAPFAPPLTLAIDGWPARLVPPALRGAATPDEMLPAIATRQAETPAVTALGPSATGALAITQPTNDRGVALPWASRSSLLVIWLAGCVAMLGWYAAGHAGLARLVRRATTLDDPSWQPMLDEVAARYDVSRPVRLARSTTIGAPLTWGWARPVILVPDDAESWPSARRRAVLMHEMAHVARRDFAAQCAANLTCALYWFHPGVWVAARRLRNESELACDDRVIAAGTPAPDYATHLLEVARGARELRLAGSVAVGMARRSHLEGRLLAVLDDARTRRAPSASACIVASAVVALLLVPVAALRPELRASAVQDGRTRVAAVQPETIVTRRGRRDRSADEDTAITITRGQTYSVKAGRGERDAERGSGVVTLRSGDVVGSSSRSEGADSTFERTVAASPGGLLTLELETGATVDVRGWDEPRVRVRGRLAGPDWRDSEVRVEESRDGVRVRSDMIRRQRSFSTSHELEISVPRRYDVRISSAGGRLTITGVEGTMRGHSGGGGLILDDVSGRASLTTGGGDIRVTDSDLEGTVSTGGGMVRLSRVRGGLRGSSGSGPVIYADEGETRQSEAEPRNRSGSGSGSSARASSGSEPSVRAGSGSGSSARSGSGSGSGDARGDIDRLRVSDDRITGGGALATSTLHIRKAGGAIDLDDAPRGAVVHTGGGAVTVRRGAGFVDASTGGGDVTIGPIAGSVRAGTGAGEVHVTLADARGDEQSVEITSGLGRVIVELPAGFDGRFEIETAYTRRFNRATRIVSDFGLDREPETDWDDSQGTPRRYVRATGVAGAGRGLVRIRTVNGDIEVRRAGRR